MLQKLSYNLAQAFSALIARPLQSFLTSLGIIFGVGAVIAMMAIGQGAKLEVLEQMKILGSNNLIIMPIQEQQEGDVTDELGDEPESQRFSPGLTLADAQSILRIVPGIESVSPEILLETNFLRSRRKRSGKLVGVTNEFFHQSSFALEKGNTFTTQHLANSASVCIIGADVKAKFFSGEDPLGKRIKVGKNWLTVIGVAQRRSFSRSSLLDLGIRDYNMDIYVPIQTVLLRYKNRSRVSPQDIQESIQAMRDRVEGDETPKAPENYHQLDRLVVSVKDETKMYQVAGIIRRMLTRRHNQVVDTEVQIPEELLSQKEETTEMFNFVLISIAAISLLVGGHWHHEHHAGLRDGADQGNRGAAGLGGYKKGHHHAVFERGAGAVPDRGHPGHLAGRRLQRHHRTGGRGDYGGDGPAHCDLFCGIICGGGGIWNISGDEGRAAGPRGIAPTRIAS